MSDNKAEDIVEEALGFMKEDGEITGFIKNGKNDRLDAEGIDFLAFLNNGLSLTIQVKTLSYNKRFYKNSKKKCRKKKKDKRYHSKEQYGSERFSYENVTNRYKRKCLEEHRRKHPLVILLIFVDIRHYNSQPDTVLSLIKEEISVYLNK
ncbi:hypothetical protein KJ671_00195 [Patescibacteria group bacterium]|nr:hypothetical protein [Patescibacteria group bacterium]